jgi:hypothetical protein
MSEARQITHTALSPEACRDRIAAAASQTGPEIVGCDLFSQVEVFDGGDCFELRHRCEPAVFKGKVAPCGTGSIISGGIAVPAQGLYRFSVGLVLLISILLVGTSAYDLLFASHHLLTRSRTEIGPGHPATRSQHGRVLVLVPLVAIPIIVLLWPKARSVKSEVRQTLATFLEALFQVRELAAETNNDPGSRRQSGAS